MLVSRRFARHARTHVAFFVCFTLAATLAGMWTYASGRLNAASGPTEAATPDPPLSPLQVRYRLDIPGRGEIFPALSTGGPTDYWPVAVLTIFNTTSRPLVEIVAAEIPGWSRLSTQTMTIGPNETRTVSLDPELLPQAYENNEIRRATVQIRAGARGSAGYDEGYNETRPVYLHSASDFYWGEKFANAQFIARWVTPHDPAVIQLVSAARNYVRRGRLAGYHLPGSSLPGSSAPDVTGQVQDESRAIFAAMKDLGISYVDSISTFGHFTSSTERVRLPRETLAMNGANCIDMSVAFASAVENLGMEPVIVLVPGHAFAGVRLAHGSPRILYLDLTVLPDGSFERGVARAQSWLSKTPKAQVTVIDIAAARSRQIYPLPSISSQKL